MSDSLASPLVSLLIPTYNREKLVRECIASAQAQTYQNIEIIVCDNASTDTTWSVILDMARQDSRIRAFRNDTNVGPVRNWLRCLAQARGDYTKVLFSDDIVAPEYLERLVPMLNCPDVAFAYSGAYIGPVLGQGEVAYCADLPSRYSSDRYFSLLADGKVPFSPGAALFRTGDVRRNLLDMLPTKVPRDFWRHGAGPDVMLYALTAKEYTSVAAVNEPLVLFRAHAGSITVGNANNQVSDGYCAALGWFFATKISHAAWVDYIARQWLWRVMSKRSWVGIRALALANEGKGSVLEAMHIFSTGGMVFVKKTARKIVSLLHLRIAGSRGIRSKSLI